MALQCSSLLRTVTRRVAPAVRAVSTTSVRSSGDLVQVEPAGPAGVSRMLLARPPVNSLDRSMLAAIEQTLKQLESDKSVKGVVLTAAKPGVFSSGLVRVPPWRVLCRLLSFLLRAR